MPTIDVEIQPGQFVPFEIRGEKPNYVEQKEIESSFPPPNGRCAGVVVPSVFLLFS